MPILISAALSVRRMRTPAEPDSPSDMEAAAALEGALIGFMKRVGMYFSLHDLGVTDDKFDAIISDALTYGDTYVAPKTPTQDEIRRMLTDAKSRS